jgi:hypothetical protein
MSLGISRQEYLAEIEKHYNGFSFDGISRVYNPYSTLSCLRENKFKNFWITTATPTFLMKYFANRNLTIEDFIEYPITENDICNSVEIEQTSPALFLYQAGYLTLEKKIGPIKYLLNYPNFEVFASIGAMLSANIYAETREAKLSSESLAKAMLNHNAKGILEAFNFAIDGCGYDTFGEINKIKHLKRECFYRDMIVLFMLGTYEINVSKEVFSSSGRSDIVASLGNNIYVFELKVAYPEDTPEGKLLEARNQIEKRKYYRQHFFFVDTVTTMALVIDNEQRKITHYDVVDLKKSEILACEEIDTPSLKPASS